MKVSEGFQLTAKDASAILGSFDPLTFLIRFTGSPDGAAGPCEDFCANLKDESFLVAIHEFTHFVQATTTAYGLRTLAIQIDILSLKIELLRKVNGEFREGRYLSLPLLGSGSIGKLQTNKDLSITLATYNQLLSKWLYFEGGWEVPYKSLASAEPVIPNHVYQRKDFSLLGTHYTTPLFIVDMYHINREKRAVALGARHLREGAAKAVEMVQASLTGSGTVRANERVQLAGLSSANPYFVLISICSILSKGFLPKDKEVTLEELILMCDLALMLDTYVHVWAEPIAFGSPEYGNAIKFDVPPANIFMSILSSLLSSPDGIIRFDHAWTKETVISFQNSLIERMVIQGAEDVQQLTKSVNKAVHRLFEHYRKGCPVPMHLLYVYQEIISNGLRFRLDVLGGGAVIEDLLVGKETFCHMARKILPAYISKGNIYSRGYTVSEDTGIGVELNMIRDMSELTDKMLFGDGVCPEHVSRPRICKAEPWAFCGSLKQIDVQKDSERCIRSMIFCHLLNAIDAENVEWVL